MSAHLAIAAAVTLAGLAALRARRGSSSRGVPSMDAAYDRLLENALAAPALKAWLLEQYEEALDDLSEEDQADRAIEWLDTEHGISLVGGEWPTVGYIGQKERLLLRGVPFVLYHGTSSEVWGKIQEQGRLRPARTQEQVSDTMTSTRAGVYLTSDWSHVPFYARQAVARHGGQPVILSVLVYEPELERDPDDMDLAQGRFQWVTPQVSLDRVVEVDGRRR